MANPSLSSAASTPGAVSKASKASKSSSARFRQRKISVRQSLAVLWQKDIPDLEDEQQREVQKIETGVEKAEEEEHHLKQAINAHAAASAGENVAEVYIPTPDASKLWPDFKKYYKGSFTVPSSYIRTSATVEDTSGCPYCMDEEDEEFLKAMNASGKTKCTEDEFEMISYKFESVVAQKQPFLTTDPHQLMSFDQFAAIIEKELSDYESDPTERLLLTLKNRASSTTSSSSLSTMNGVSDAKVTTKDVGKQMNGVKKEVDDTKSPRKIKAEKDQNDSVKDKNKKSIDGTSTALNHQSIYTPASIYTPIFKHSSRSLVEAFKLFGSKIYDHWKDRKIRRGGKAIFPVLKFEENSEKDDNDPYVCFRRREARQTRKTRRTDSQSTERLRRLQAEMQTALQLMQMVVKRETMRKEALTMEKDIFMQRAKVKSLKRKLGIAGDDDDLVAHKKKKVEEKKPVRKTASSQAPGQNGPAAAKANREKAEAATPAAPHHTIPSNVRLPASKIPDMDLVTVEQKLREKEEATRRYIEKQLESRIQADRGWINYSDNPFVPYADYFDPPVTGDLDIIDPRHAAYSSIASTYPVRKEDAHCNPLKLPLATSLGKNYSLRVEVSPMVLHTRTSEDGDDMEVVQSLTEKDIASRVGTLSVPRESCISLRKRMGRGGRLMVDRRGIMKKASQRFRQTCDYNDPATQRFLDRYKYDNESNTDHMEFPGSDPSRLNKVSEGTQSIRFGAMLLGKAYDTYKQAYQSRQQQLLSFQQKALQMQRQTQVRAQGQTPNTSAPPSQSSSQSPSDTTATAAVSRNASNSQLLQQKPRLSPGNLGGSTNGSTPHNNSNTDLGSSGGRVVNVPRVGATS